MDMQVPKLHARVIAHVATGDIVDLEGFTIDANWVRDLLTGRLMPRAWHQAVAKIQSGYECYVSEDEHAAAPVSGSGIHIRNATITGKLDLSWQISSPLPRLCLENCRLLGNGETEGDVMTCLDLRHAHLVELSLRGSQVSHVLASDLVVDGNVDITGLAPLGEWHEQQWPGIRAEDLEEKAKTLARRVEYELRKCRAVDHLCLQSMVPSKKEREVKQWLNDCMQHCWCDFARAKIAGHFFADSVRLRIPMRTGLTDCETRRCCIDLSHSHIDGSLHLRNAPVLEGSLDIDAARIEGDVRVEGCRLDKGERESALAAHGARIGGSVYILPVTAGSMRIFGRLWLATARISGDLDLSGSLLDGDGDDALIAEGLTVEGSIMMRANLASHGGLWLYACKVGGELEISGATVLPTLKQAGKHQLRHPIALVGYGMHVQGQILLFRNVLVGMVDMRGAECATLQDDVSGYRGAWPIRFDGFRYERVEYLQLYGRVVDGHPRDMSTFWQDHERLLKREVPFRPQPYVHMAQILIQHGFEGHARRVFKCKIDRELHERRVPFLPTQKKVRERPSLLARHVFSKYLPELLPRWGQTLFGLFFGYGLLPSRAIATLLATLGIGWAAFTLMENRGMLAIAQQPVAQELSSDGTKLGVFRKISNNNVEEFTESVPCGTQIRTSLYALDVFVPLVDLHEEEKCEIGAIKGGHPWRDADDDPLRFEEMAYRVFKAAYAIIGGIITSLALLTFSGIMRNRMTQQE